MIVVQYKDKIYRGETLKEVFLKFWNAHKGKPIYSSNKKIYIKNWFEAMMMQIINVFGARLLQSQFSEKREATEEEKKEFNKLVEAIKPFLEHIEDKEYMQPDYLFAFGEITKVIKILKIDEKTKNEIEKAKNELTKIVPERFLKILKQDAC